MIDLDRTVEEMDAAGRAVLLRGVLLYGTFLVIALAGVATLIASGLEGALYVWLVIVLVVAGLLAHIVWQHAKDMRSVPVESEGSIARKWQRADLVIVWQSFYVQVERRIFRLDARDYLLVEEGQRVRVRHFPRTLSVVRVEIVKGS
jgi:hypothetical protein